MISRINAYFFRVGIPFTDLTQPHFCARPKPGLTFSMPYVFVFFVFNSLSTRCGRDSMAFGFTITCAISAYHH
jgi:hypothetical protein